ncbi:MAG: M48 family metallopeptidase [Firmicutes bacterium]|nr:M48 family metallopeptidase [Bacillota bacterium]
MKNGEERYFVEGLEFRLCRERRRTLSIRILDGRVSVFAPLNTAYSAIEAFVVKKRRWISAKVEEYDKKQRTFLDVLTYRAFLLDGEKYPTQVCGGSKTITFSEGKVLIPSALVISEQKLIKAARAWYERLAKSVLLDRLKQFSAAFGFVFSAFAVSNAKSKWGSCDQKNRIRLSWRLIMLLPDIRDYVIIHELCHTKYHHHGKEFWAKVREICPQSQQIRKRLEDYSVLMGLYRIRK